MTNFAERQNERPKVGTASSTVSIVSCVSVTAGTTTINQSLVSAMAGAILAGAVVSKTLFQSREKRCQIRSNHEKLRV